MTVLTSAVALVLLWCWIAKRMPQIVQELPLEEFSRRQLWSPLLGAPSFVWVGLVGLGFLVTAWSISRRAVLRTFATLSTVTFLAFGLWLPIASRLWCGAMLRWSEYLDADFALAHPLALVAWVVVPPIATAIAFTRLENRLSRRVITIVITVGFVCAVASRYGAQVAGTRCIGPVPAVDCPSLVFVSFIHLLVASALVACGAVLGLALGDRRPRAVAAPGLHYLVFLVIAGVPNLIAINQSFGFLR